MERELTSPPAGLAWTPASQARLPRHVAMENAAAAALRGVEHAFAVAGLFLFSHGLLLLLLQGTAAAGADPHQENAVLRNVFNTLHAGSLLLLALHWREALRALRGRLSIVALVLLAILSTQWSEAPDLTLRRSLALLGTTAFGVFLAVRFDARTLLKLLAAALGIAGVLSVGFALALPGLGIAGGDHAGDWQGIYTNKNTLGKVMVLGTTAFVLLHPLLTRRWRWLAAAGAVLCLGLVLMSQSKTALSVALSLLACLAVFRALRLRATLAVPVVIGAVLAAGSAAVVIVDQMENILAAMGKDPSLTGRTPIWSSLLQSIAERPWLGYGYNGYWLGERGPAEETIRTIGWETPSAHNGFLEVALQVGVIGLAIFLLGYLRVFNRAFGVVRRAPTADGLWPLAICTFTLLYNVTESVLMERNSVYWALFVAVACSPLLRGSTGRAARTPEDGEPEPGRALAVRGRG